MTTEEDQKILYDYPTHCTACFKFLASDSDVYSSGFVQMSEPRCSEHKAIHGSSSPPPSAKKFRCDGCYKDFPALHLYKVREHIYECRSCMTEALAQQLVVSHNSLAQLWAETTGDVPLCEVCGIPDLNTEQRYWVFRDRNFLFDCRAFCWHHITDDIQQNCIDQGWLMTEPVNIGNVNPPSLQPIQIVRKKISYRPTPKV